MISLLKYLFAQSDRDKLPRLKNHLTSKLDREAEIDLDTEIVLMRGLVRDARQARALMAAHEASSAEALLDKLPEPPGPDWRGRFRRWLLHLEGSYDSDPHLKEDRETLRQFPGWVDQWP